MRTYNVINCALCCILFVFQVSIEPEDDRDVLGRTFRDLQGYVHEKMNKSTQDVDQTRTKLEKADLENQSLREQLKRLDEKLNKRDDKVKNEKNKVNTVIS